MCTKLGRLYNTMNIQLKIRRGTSMIFTIARIMDINENIFGFRLIDTFKEQIIDLSYDELADKVSKGIIRIENSVRTYGIDDITLLNSNLQPVGKPHIFILGILSNTTYVCCDFNGQITEITEEELLEHSKTVKIDNAFFMNDMIIPINEFVDMKQKAIQERKMYSYIAKAKLLGKDNFLIQSSGNDIVLVKYIGTEVEIEIPNFITIIEEEAFYESDIETVDISNGVTEIKDNAFSFCTKLKEIKLPNSLLYIGKGAFLMCRSLKSIEIPEKVLKIPKKAFKNCRTLRDVKLNRNITTICEGAFSDCNLKTISLPDTLTRLERFSFTHCTELETVKFNGDIDQLNGEVFYSCNKLNKIILNSSCLISNKAYIATVQICIGKD